MEDLQRLGSKSVPIVSRGDKFVFAQVIRDVVDFKIVEGTNHFSLLDHAMSEDYELNKKVIEFIQNQQKIK